MKGNFMKMKMNGDTNNCARMIILILTVKAMGFKDIINNYQQIRKPMLFYY